MNGIKRSLASAFLGFYGLVTIFPAAILLRFINNVFILILLNSQADKDIIDAGDFSAPFILIILGGIFAYRLTGIAAANSTGKDNLALSAMICSVPVGMSFAALDIICTKLFAVWIYSKPVRFFLEPEYATAMDISTFENTKAISVLFGISSLIYLWAFLAGCIVGMFIINKCKVRLTLTIATSIVSFILLFMIPDSYIVALLFSLVNPVCFVYGSITAFGYAIRDNDIFFNFILIFLISIASITGNLVLIKPNIPLYRRKHK